MYDKQSTVAISTCSLHYSSFVQLWYSLYSTITNSAIRLQYRPLLHEIYDHVKRRLQCYINCIAVFYIVLLCLLKEYYNMLHKLRCNLLRSSIINIKWISNEYHNMLYKPQYCALCITNINTERRIQYFTKLYVFRSSITNIESTNIWKGITIKIILTKKTLKCL